MSKHIILALAAICVFVPVTYADAEYPSCSQSQLSVILELVPAYDSLETQRRRVKTPNQLLDYTRAQLTQRETTWKTLPRCAEAIEYGELMSRRYELYSAYMTYEFLLAHTYRSGQWTSDNPYSGPFFDEAYKKRYRELQTKIEATLSDGRAANKPNTFLPPCTVSEQENLYLAIEEYRLLHEAFSGMKNVLDNYEFNSAIVPWSDRLRSQLPACDLAFETGLLMRQHLLDRALLFDLTLADLPTENHPYWETSQKVFDELYERIVDNSAKIRAHESWWPYTGMLDLCTAAQVETLAEILQGYMKLLATLADDQSNMDLVAFGRAQFEWRQHSWQNMPPCAEALEIALVIYHWAGDTFELAGSDSSALPASVFSSLEEALTGGIHLSERLGQIAATYEGEFEYPDTFAEDKDPPTCSAEAVDGIAESINGFLALLEIAEARNEWTGGYLTYVDALLAWRMEMATKTPDCRIRLDLSSALASSVAGFIAANLPGVGQLLTHPGGTSPETAPVVIADVSTSDSAWVRSNNLRACSIDELRRVQDDLDSYMSVIDDAPAIRTVADLLEQVNQVLVWRDEQWVDLLTCAETFEIGLLINRIASDTLAAHALELAGFSPILNPLFKSQRDLDKLSERIHFIPVIIREREQAATQPAESSALPHCSDEELGAVLALLNEFRKGPRLLTKAFTPETVRSYSQFQTAWREAIWAEIPACFEAVEIGLLMSRQSADVVTMYALPEANVSEEDDPFWGPGFCDTRAFGSWLLVLTTGNRDALVDVFSCVGLALP